MEVMTENKIIKIKDYQLRKMNKNQLSNQLLNECRDLMTNHLSQSLSVAMNKVDDLFFELSSRTSDLLMHDQYLYAMRELRLKKSRIVFNFRKNINSSFDKAINNHSGVMQKRQEEKGIKESIALMNTVSKVTKNCQIALYTLDKRMSELLNDTTSIKKINPAGPEPICAAFLNACNENGLCIETKLVLFNLFEKYVAMDLQSTYTQINNLFAGSELDGLNDEPQINLIENQCRVAQNVPKRKTYYIDAISSVNNTIRNHIGNSDLPGFAEKFLHEHWSKLMLKIYLRDGAGGRAWIHAVDVIDDMVNCIGQHTSTTEKQSMAGLMVKLKMRLIYGMNVIPVSPILRDEFITELSQYYKNLLQPTAKEVDCVNKLIDEDTKTSTHSIKLNSIPFAEELFVDVSHNIKLNDNK